MKKLITLLALGFCLNGRAQIITTVAGDGFCCPFTSGGAATASNIYYPRGVAVDAMGNIFIAGGNAIQKVDAATGILITVAGTGTGGNNGDGGQATNAQLEPSDVAIDIHGNIYVADWYNKVIRKINTLGIISSIASNQVAPNGIALDASNNIYTANDGNYIAKINTSGIVSHIAGISGFGYSGDGGPATAATLNNPTGVALDSKGNIYIADNANNRVRMINTSGIISTVAGNGNYLHNGDGGHATAASIWNPSDVSVDATGNLFICSSGSSCIRMVNTLGIIFTIAGDTIYGYTGDGGPATAAELEEPWGITLDASGNLYIADVNGNCIRKVTNAAAAGIEQYNVNYEVNIYPNPNNGSFVIEPQNTLYNVHCTVYDVNGEAVLSQPINGKTSIDASSLNEGVYNISLISDEGVVNKRLVIVR